MGPKPKTDSTKQCVRFLVIGDPHFKVGNAEETDIMHQVIWQHMIDVPIRYYHHVIVLGDVLDRHNIVDIRPLKRAIDFIEMLRDVITEGFRDGCVHVLKGNHDSINNSVFLDGYHPFYGMCDEDVNIVTNSNMVEMCNENGYYVNVLLVPYVPPNRFMEAVRYDKVSLEDGTIKLVFAHQEFRGCNLGDRKSEIEESWPENYPLCVSGHIHGYHVPQTNLVYPGSPLVVSFGESPDKALMEVTVYEDNTIEYKRIKLNLPSKVSIDMVSNDVRETLKTWKPRLNTQYRWRIYGPTKDITVLKKLKFPKGVVCQWFSTDRKHSQRQITVGGFRSFEDILKSIVSDVKAMNLYYEIKRQIQ